jgi:hypothetical protein
MVMALVIHVHAQVHHHIHLIMRRTYVKGLSHEEVKSERMYYDSLPGIPQMLATEPDIDTSIYKFHIEHLLHIHVYPY